MGPVFIAKGYQTFGLLSYRGKQHLQRHLLDGQRHLFLGPPDFECPSQALFSTSEGPFSTSEALLTPFDPLKSGS